jgi:hypothetical protein
MRNTETWQYLSSFSHKERKQLRLWLISPAINNREEVVRLFDFLDKNLSKITDREISKEKAWAAIFPNEKFDSKKLYYTGHYLLRLTQSYLAYLEFENEPQRKQLYLCKNLKKRQLDTFFEREMRALDDLHGRNTHAGDADFHFNRYQFHVENHDYLSRRSRSVELPLQPLLDTLGDYYIATLLRYSCSAQTRTTVANQHFQLKMLPDVLRYLDENLPNPDVSPSVAVYYRCYRLLDGSGGDADFYELKSFLWEHWQKFPLPEIRDIWLLAINYGIRRINSGQKNFIRETFELYREGLGKNILPGDGNLTDFTYKNIARLGLGLREFEWTEVFLIESRYFLDPSTRENMFQYCMAMFHFYQKNYDKALEILTKVELSDVFLNLDARSMLLRIYFEKDFYDALESLLDSFQSFIKRQKNLGYQAENYLNLILFTRQILRLPPNDIVARQKINEEVVSTSALAEKDWVLGIVNKGIKN